MLCVVKANKFIDSLAKDQKDWFVCTHGNMAEILSALSSFTNTNKMRGPVTLEMLVHAKRLPEWSPIYVCPTILRPGIEDTFWTNVDKAPRFNPWSPSPIAAHYSESPYYIETVSNGFRIHCRNHTNYTASMDR